MGGIKYLWNLVLSRDFVDKGLLGPGVLLCSEFCGTELSAPAPELQIYPQGCFFAHN